MRLVALACLGLLLSVLPGGGSWLAAEIAPAGSAGTVSTRLLTVTLRADGTGASLPEASVDLIEGEIARLNTHYPELQIVGQGGQYEVVRFARRLGAIIGPEGAVRQTFPLTDEGHFISAADASGVAGRLANFALQERLRNLANQGALATDMHLRTVPVAGADNCRGIDWTGGGWGEVQSVPLCQSFRIEAQITRAGGPAVRGHLFVLSNEGAIHRLRSAGDLPSGSVYSDFVAAQGGGTVPLRAAPPVNVPDTALLVLVPHTAIVDWNVLLSGTPRDILAANAITRDIYRVMTGAGEPAFAWSAVALPIRTIASDLDAGQRPAPGGPASLREYTLNGFDISPYLPADTSSSLFKVLGQADWLANHAQTDGIPYKQHTWPGGEDPVNDAANLATGIDCSRSIWFAFTRAGLPYNRSDQYLATADMVTSKTWMKDEFLACEAPYRAGDVLVYRDDGRGVGHTVMVVDGEQRIAWGSHGWDGNGRLMNVTPDTGVEYQLIKIKTDWERWDSANMTLRACWRHRNFEQEWAENPAARAGSTQVRGCDNMCPAPSQTIREEEARGI